jgi:hypothetical protein
MNDSTGDRHSEALRAWRRWKSGRFPRDRDRAIVQLWWLCEEEIWAVARELAERLGEALGRHITVPAWRHAQGWTEDDVRQRAFPAIGEAAKGFDLRKGAAFQTYAYYYIKGEFLRAVPKQDGLVVAVQIDEEIAETLSDRDSEAGDGRDVWCLFELDDAPKPGGSELGRALVLDSETLYLLRDWLDENRERASEVYDARQWFQVWTMVGTSAWLTHWQEISSPGLGLGFADSGVLPIKGVAIDTSTGRTVDIIKPLEAHHLKHRAGGMSDRTVAGRLGVSKDKVRRWRLRMSEQGFDQSGFTADDLYDIANDKPGPKPKDDQEAQGTPRT